MAVRFYWMDNANLLLTAGGFHPAYTPPPMNLRALARLSIVLFEGNPDVRAEAYFAVTSNTVPVRRAARTEIQRQRIQRLGLRQPRRRSSRRSRSTSSPISRRMLAVQSAATRCSRSSLALTLEGPLPWHAQGTASFEIGFIFTITIHVPFDVTVGAVAAAVLAPIDVLAEIAAAVADLANWRPRLPVGSSQSVTLRALPDRRRHLVLHPYGFARRLAEARRRSAFRSSATARPRRCAAACSASSTSGSAAQPATPTPTREEFAPAQFFEMSDAEKLSRPSFSEFDAGVAIGGDPLPHADFMRQRDVAYEVIYLPEHAHGPASSSACRTLARQFSVAGAAVSRSPLSHARRSAVRRSSERDL